MNVQGLLSLLCCSLLAGACALPSAMAEPPFVGAGILPYCFDQDRVFVLLGFDHHKGAWTDFGGGGEKVTSLEDGQRRWETRVQTAMREAIEESRGILGRQQIKAAVDPGRFFDHPTLDYRIFTANIGCIPAANFRQVPVPVGERWDHWREKSDFYWIDLALLKDQVATAKDRQSALLTQAPGGVRPLFSLLYDSLSQQFSRGEDGRLFSK